MFPIVGGRKVEHLKGNIEGLTVRLTTEDFAEVENAFQFDPGFPQTFLSGTIAAGSDAPQKLASRASEVHWTAAQGTIDWVEDSKAIKPTVL